eukprot:scaffold2816_cov121-Cylindrotheca_fusiformis.AAC.39
MFLTLELRTMENSKERGNEAHWLGTELDSSKKLTSDSGNHFTDLAGQGDSNPSRPSDHKHSESLSLLEPGEQSWRDRRRMNRREERRGGPNHHDGSRSRQALYYRPRDDRSRGRNSERDDRYYNGGRGSPRGRHFRAPRDRPSRSPVERRGYSRSPSNGGSVGSRHSFRSRSRSRSRGRNDERSRSPRENSQNGRARRSGRHSVWHDRRETITRGAYGGQHGRHGGEGRDKLSRRSHSPSSSSESSSSSSSSEEQLDEGRIGDSTFSKDQRTVFVSQLVMRATEKDIRRYFRRKVGCKVNEVILLRDKRTGNHKGGAYMEMGRMEDVNKAVGVTGLPPDFQRFPILVKASEAEKNYVVPASSSVVTTKMTAVRPSATPFLTTDGRVVESQKVYIGGLDPSVGEEHLFALFSQFGELEKVDMQVEPGTQTSRGFAFLSFKDPKVANLAIQTMSNRTLAGRPMKTGWASHPSSISGVDIVTSEEFPEDATIRTQKAFAVLTQLGGSAVAGYGNSGSSASGSTTSEPGSGNAVGDVLTPLSAGLVNSTKPERKEIIDGVVNTAVLRRDQPIKVVSVASPNTSLGNSASQSGPELLRGNLTKAILVHNMFDKDTETEEGWAEELKEEFTEECEKFGRIAEVMVMSDQPGGKIYAVFETLESARLCANNLAGRWFDKRKLRVEFVDESSTPNGSNRK